MILITGMSADKDIQGMIDAWLPRTAHIITTQSGHPRAIPPDELADQIRKLTDVPVTAEQTAAKSLQAALEIVRDDQLIIATGSVFRSCQRAGRLDGTEKIGAKYLMEENNWDPFNEDEFAEAMHRRTEELYSVQDLLPNDHGLINGPVLAMRDMVIYPHMVSPLFVGRDPTLWAIEKAQSNNQTLIALTQRDPSIDNPGPDDFFPIGVEMAVGRSAQHARWFLLGIGASPSPGGVDRIHPNRTFPSGKCTTCLRKCTC